MPAHDSIRLHNVHPLPPATPESGQQNPEQSVGLLEAETRWSAALEHGYLVAESGDLSLQGGAGLKCSGKPSEHCDEDRAHCQNDDDLRKYPNSR
jgi:hypothetical protein